MKLGTWLWLRLHDLRMPGTSWRWLAYGLVVLFLSQTFIAALVLETLAVVCFLIFFKAVSKE